MSDLLAIFAKAPRPGSVKTRLCPPLTPEQAAAVHEASLRDVLERARSTGIPITLFHDPGDASRAFFQSLGGSEPLLPQVGADLGSRLAAAFDLCFARGAARVLIIGADSPTLPPARLTEALEALDRFPAVLGPAEDGGYYLVGLRRDVWPHAAALFTGIPWSSDEVLAASRAAAADAGLDLFLLDPWFDVDRAPELRRALAQAAESSHLHALARADPAISRVLEATST